jgi:hypothetical protein
MRLVECVNKEPWLIGSGPQYGEVCEVVSEHSRNSFLYYQLSGYGDGGYLSERFREIEFPPSLMEQVTESLTRELVSHGS